MTDRRTVDSINSDQLDQLYDDLDRAEAAIERVRAIPRIPHHSQQTGELGRAYTRGWESVIAAIDTALDDPQDQP